jgi:hypothetical protein
MDIYLPADFYALRCDLNDWRDSGTSTDTEKSAVGKIESPDQGDADPYWKVL